MGPPRVIWRGEVDDVGLGQPVGHEPALRRPAAVVSVDTLNNSPAQLVTVVPVTSAYYGLHSHVEVEPGSSGLGHTSYAPCDQLRVISTARLASRRGMIAPDTMRDIDQALCFVLDLCEDGCCSVDSPRQA
ncbi:MAG: type II toxin-antitoxin system PemK/MazF family toxin [Dermatophilaceae bacterium]